MHLSGRILFALGALAAASALGLDAWHAHGLRDALEPEAYDAFGRGIRVQYVAATGLLAAGLLLGRAASRLGVAAGVALAVGGLLFCSEVYRGALGAGTLGLAPAGGMLSMAGWLALGAAALSGGRGRD